MKAIPQCLVTLSLLFVGPTQVAADELIIEAPLEAKIIDVATDETSQPGGPRVRWASVTYELSTGHEAEMFVKVDERGHGDAYVFLEGEALIHVITDEHGGTRTWAAPDGDLSPEVIAEFAAVNVADEIFAGMGEPQAFKCSEFGKSAVKAAKYLWVGLMGAAMPVCCAATGGVGCVACGAATAIGALAGTEAADGYCD
jgi:hypothetical protein